MSDLGRVTCASYETALQEAFPGVRFWKFSFYSNPYDDDGVWWLDMSAPEAVLLEHGLIEADTIRSLPPSGQRRHEGITLHRGKRLLRIEWVSNREGAAWERVESRLVSALASRIWQPKTAA